MDENSENKNNKKTNTLIGVLMIIPIYMFIGFALQFITTEIIISNTMVSLLIYAPIIYGIILSYKTKPKKISKIMTCLVIVFYSISFYYYYNAYIISQEGWDGLREALLFLVVLFISRIMSCIFYGKIDSWKKALTFFIIYILIIICAYKIGLLS